MMLWCDFFFVNVGRGYKYDFFIEERIFEDKNMNYLCLNIGRICGLFLWVNYMCFYNLE